MLSEYEAQNLAQIHIYILIYIPCFPMSLDIQWLMSGPVRTEYSAESVYKEN